MYDWYKSALGRAIIECEFQCVQRILPRQYYRVCIQVEGPSQMDIFGRTDHQLVYRVAQHRQRHLANTIVGLGEWLPFDAASIDLLVLPHVLEFSEYPHDVLREASACVSSNGVLVIIGFNPRSLLNLMKTVNWFGEVLPQQIDFYSVHRIREWLSLLEFEILAGEFTFFRPPFRQDKHLKKFQLLETAGSRWWPAMGSVYVLVARKKDLGIRMTPKFSNDVFKRRRLAVGA